MKENRALSGGLCALGCEVLYGLSYLFTKRTADAASALALLGWRFIVALTVMSLCVAVIAALALICRKGSLKPAR